MSVVLKQSKAKCISRNELIKVSDIIYEVLRVSISNQVIAECIPVKTKDLDVIEYYGSILRLILNIDDTYDYLAFSDKKK